MLRKMKMKLRLILVGAWPKSRIQDVETTNLNRPLFVLSNSGLQNFSALNIQTSTPRMKTGPSPQQKMFVCRELRVRGDPGLGHPAESAQIESKLHRKQFSSPEVAVGCIERVRLLSREQRFIWTR
jgi:hypothetical protein